MKKALCVGINDYPGYANDLSGCVNDANDWAKELRDSFKFSVETLLDTQATKANILAKFNSLIENATDGDVIVLTYSGHGTQVFDYEDDEEDGYDEALYVYDGTIKDDEFRGILDKALPTVSVYVIFDSCFSGTMTRRPQAGKIKFVQTERTMKKKVRNRLMGQESITELLLTGCTDAEYSYDAFINGRYNGAMTYYAIKALQENYESTWNQFYNRLRNYLPSYDYPQTPQLEGKEEMKEKLVFSKKGDEVPPAEEEQQSYLTFLLIGVGILAILIVLLINSYS